MKRQRWNTKRIIAAFTILISLIVALICLGIISHEYNENIREMTPMARSGYCIEFDTYVVKSGDTLFTITQDWIEANPNLEDDGFEKVLWNIKFHNGIESENDVLVNGTELILPYYKLYVR